MTPEPWDGGCLCGSLRYRVAGRPLSTGYCHCRMCQRSSGAPVLAWATVPRAAYAWTAGTPAMFQSSANGQRLFCGRCGTQILFQNAPETETVDFNVPTLDDPTALPPEHHSWTESQIPWFDTADHLPRHPGATPSGS